MKCKVEGCRFSDKHKTENHECGKCSRLGHGQRECGDWLKCEELTRTIDRDNYYDGRIIISYEEDSNTDDYWPYQASYYDKIRKEMRNNSYIKVGSGMGSIVLYKKISVNRILMKVIDDYNYFSGNADKLQKDFIGNRSEQKLSDFEIKNFPKQKEINLPYNINGNMYAPIL
jgi:hypothetical protein